MDSNRLSAIWVYLAQTPLLWLTATIAIYQLTVLLTRRLNIERVLNPVLLSIIIIVPSSSVTMMMMLNPVLLSIIIIVTLRDLL